jgi:hypothetical protein
MKNGKISIHPSINPSINQSMQNILSSFQIVMSGRTFTKMVGCKKYLGEEYIITKPMHKTKEKEGRGHTRPGRTPTACVAVPCARKGCTTCTHIHARTHKHTHDRTTKIPPEQHAFSTLLRTTACTRRPGLPRARHSCGCASPFCACCCSKQCGKPYPACG